MGPVVLLWKREDVCGQHAPLHALSQYGLQGISHSGLWTLTFLGTGLMIDAFHVLGTVQVYSKNWNSLVKTALSFQNTST